MASRRKARILAFQALYAWDASGTPVPELLSFSWLEPERFASIEEEHRIFARLLIAGTVENIAEVDAAIKAQLQNWSFERLKRVDLAILRIGAYSLLFQRDIPIQITIDEAIEIAKEYGSDDSYRFINGVLDGIRKAQAT
ncbi:MAG TPA: transcription antitermination factor NusB [Rectinemataceae bacterium]|nr:transcription antitermination factor NusB [Rectinemataceae bacterium]